MECIGARRKQKMGMRRKLENNKGAKHDTEADTAVEVPVISSNDVSERKRGREEERKRGREEERKRGREEERKRGSGSSM
jgi:hypothetical protein